MTDPNWITLSTTPPSAQDIFDQLVAALDQTGIPIDLEENLGRQCENDVAFWLRVRVDDLPLAWKLAQKLNIE
jgi:hypothetical protein